MSEGPAPLTVEQHLQQVLAGVAPLAPVTVPLLDALGLVAAADVDSSLDLPGFDNSAMDGYAVRAADLASASEEAPVELPVVGQIGAGSGSGGDAPVEVTAGVVAKIMTGARLPEGADSVVPYEWTDRGAERVVVRRAPELGASVRPAGDDVRRGERLVDAGTLLTPRHLGVLAAVGVAAVEVHPRPRVAILSTGSELRQPGEELGPDSIYDGNSYLLAAAATQAGFTPVRVGIVPDRPEAFLALLDRTLGSVDAVVTSGGVSQGDFDVVKEALRPRGIWFGPVAMQPGKPQGFGVLEGTPVFTLPGNPVSSYLSFELFVVPALRAMAGQPAAARATVSARLATDVRSPAGRRQFLRGRLVDGEAVPVGGPGSHLVGGLAHADALIVVPEDVTSLEAGAAVEVVRLDDARAAAGARGAGS